MAEFKPPTELKWLYIDFNSYFASVEQQLDPRLRGKPVAVIPVETESTCAIAASYEAKAFGVKTGTPVYEARKMCPGLICVIGDHQKYVECHEKILDEIDRHIPVEKVCSIDEMACRLMKNETSVARVTDIAARVKQGLARNVGEYIRCSIGVAPNKYLSKIATDMQKPDGFTILHAGDLPHRLESLQLRDLPGIGANMEKRLNAAGIREMKHLLAMPPKHLRAVWGSLWGEKMWYYLRGYDLPDTENARGSVGHSHVLSPEMRPPDEAVKIARRLTTKAAARLRRMDYYAGAFSLSLRVENGPRLGLEARLPQAQDSFAFLDVLESMWAQLQPELKNRRIKKVAITLSSIVPAGQVQPDLFDSVAATGGKRREKNEKLSNAMDKLNQKFGRDTVLVGLTGSQGRAFSGTKIAFTRIPDVEEFAE
ncbi:MAG TPA: impB/mucB/samB family protein [Patescibacteria group bacterium]|nr:impB/mucB/samB family protein [Patescibacteria group bacterium]